MAHIAQKIRFYPNDDQRVLLEKSFGVSRFVYNWGLSKWDELYKRKEKTSAYSLRAELNKIYKEEFPWMAEVPKDIKAESLKDLHQGFKNFFDKKLKAKYPKKKKRGKAKFSFRLPNDRVKISETGARLSVIGEVRLAEKIKHEGKLLSATISRQADRYFISLAFEIDNKIVTHSRPGSSIGMDLGIKTDMVLSNEKNYKGPASYRSLQKKLKKAQKRLSLTIKGSNNRKKQILRVGRIHLKIANKRKDFIEKTTSMILRRYETVAVENLNVAGMVKNRKLAKSLMDVSFGTIVTRLKTKAERYGSKVVEIGRFFPSSKQCAGCGKKNEGLTLSDRMYHCACGVSLDRDHHAAINIHKEGLRIQASSKNTVSSTGINACGENDHCPKTTVKKASRLVETGINLNQIT